VVRAFTPVFGVCYRSSCEQFVSYSPAGRPAECGLHFRPAVSIAGRQRAGLRHFLARPGGHVLTWNAGAEFIKGYAKDEILGKHFSIFYLPEAKKSAWPDRELELAIKEGRFQDEGWRVKKDGSTFWASVTITALRRRMGACTDLRR
jgi:PAS domain S-box-containing protein